MSKRIRRINLTFKLLLIVAIGLLIVIGIQTGLNIRSALQHQDANAKERLQNLYADYLADVRMQEASAETPISAFLDSLKQRLGADFTLWITTEVAGSVGFTPSAAALNPPIPAILYYNATLPVLLPIPQEIYTRVFTTGKEETAFISINDQQKAVMVAPLYGDGNRLVGLVEISTARGESLALLIKRQLTGAGIAAAAALLVFIILWAAITVFVVHPVIHLQETADRWSIGDLMARTRLTTGDELEQLGEGLDTLAQKLDESIKGMERSVTERTREMARQTMYLEAAAEVSRAATSILDTRVLMQQVVELIRERFGSYFVGLFLVDEAREWANLQTGTGEAGKAMLARHHRIKIGQGMIGWCISNSRSRVAQEAVQDLIRLETSELPKTRAEAALPLRSRGRVIGALTVQSVTPGAFDEGTVTILQTMADQVAIALDNARLFAESSEALDTARRAYGELSRSAWAELLRTQPVIGYRCDSQGVAPLTVTFESTSTKPEDEQVMTLPIKVRGQVLGNIKAHKPQRAGRWTTEETELMNTMADQLSVALDNARLYRDTQRSAEREHITSDITAKVRASTNINVILRTAVQELADALHIPKASIQLRGGDGETSE